MEKQIKNMEHRAVLPMAEQVQYLSGQIVSKTLAQNRYHSLTLFAFDKGEEISAHESDGDALVQVLDGVARVTIAGRDYRLQAGEGIVMPGKVPHAVFAAERFKMLLTVLFPENHGKR